MRAVVQRVTQASVTVNGELISSIGKGLCVLVGISRHDTDKDIEYIVRKLLNLRLWDGDGDNGKRWVKSLSSQKLEILCVSQFTLYHQLKGNVPDFHNAMAAQDSKPFFDKFISQLKASYSEELVKANELHKIDRVIKDKKLTPLLPLKKFGRANSSMGGEVGKFGNYMQVNIQGDGPVTIQLESPSTANVVNKTKACNQPNSESSSTVPASVSSSGDSNNS